MQIADTPFRILEKLSPAASKLYIYFLMTSITSRATTISGSVFNFQKYLQMSDPTIRRALWELKQIGILQSDPTQRGRVDYVFHDLLVEVVRDSAIDNLAKKYAPPADPEPPTLTDNERVELQQQILKKVNRLLIQTENSRFWNHYHLNNRGKTWDDFCSHFFETKWQAREQFLSDAELKKMAARLEQQPHLDAIMHEFPLP